MWASQMLLCKPNVIVLLSNMSQAPTVSIIYAPSPDESISDQEECAAFQYANRAKEALLVSPSFEENHISSWNVAISCIEESSFENILSCQESENPSDENETSSPKALVLLILSCSADGSIHRSLRKATKRLGKQDNRSHIIHLGVVLLGHARCDNSAKQMKQTIFGSGRRIEKTLLTTRNDAFVSIQERLETQVELVGPEEEFDPWWSSVIQKFQSP